MGEKQLLSLNSIGKMMINDTSLSLNLRWQGYDFEFFLDGRHRSYEIEGRWWADRPREHSLPAVTVGIIFFVLGHWITCATDRLASVLVLVLVPHVRVRSLPTLPSVRRHIARSVRTDIP
jgi:hypothetical protein